MTLASHVAANTPSLSPALNAVRLTLHVLAATIWVGGQFTAAGLLPTVRGLSPDAPKQVARALARLLWPAYAVLIITGLWNISSFDLTGAPSAWTAVLSVKIAVVVVAGVAVFLHQRATTKAALAVWGSIGATASVAALVLGVMLAG
jgi:putative copper export protein